MDDTDQRLIAELRRDGRASLSELAERLDLSRATVRARMERLTERGEIAGFTVLTRGDVTAAPVRGLRIFSRVSWPFSSWSPIRRSVSI